MLVRLNIGKPKSLRVIKNLIDSNGVLKRKPTYIALATVRDDPREDEGGKQQSHQEGGQRSLPPSVESKESSKEGSRTKPSPSSLSSMTDKESKVEGHGEEERENAKETTVERKKGGRGGSDTGSRSVPSSQEDPQVYPVGVIVRVSQLKRAGKALFTMLVEGVCRFELLRVVQSEPFWRVRLRPFSASSPAATRGEEQEIRALSHSIARCAKELLGLLKPRDGKLNPRTKECKRIFFFLIFFF